ncbi:MAG: hypothetical protein IKF78_12805 [Atopobiaceae bacterium]|nr:hypothetical protein [Atopobiaceae bacterium]
MHILAAASALRVVRAIRSWDTGISLPIPELRRDRVLLPGEEYDATFDECDEDLTFQVTPTLEEAGFGFDDAESNARVDLSRLGEVGSFTQESPLELAVFSESRKFHRKKSVARTMPKTLPARSIVRIDADLCMVCPELIVLQMASRLSEMTLAQLIMELCGTYSLSPVSEGDATGAKEVRTDDWDADAWDVSKRNADECAFDLEPVTNIERIRWYSQHVRVRGGAAKLRDALRLAIEGSASPPETIVALMLSLPREKGGYGLGRPSLNARLDVMPTEYSSVGKNVYFLDAFWQDAFADVEYESTSFHLDPLVALTFVAARAGDSEADDAIYEWRREYVTKADADRRRLRDLQYLGVQVIPVTAFDLKDVDRLDQVARSLARCRERATGVNLGTWAESLGEWDYKEARRGLLRELRDASRLGGPV